MSFILDALRKSERERQRNQGPGVAQPWRPGGQNNKSFWIPLVMLLVGLNLSLLLFMWWKSSPDPEVAATNSEGSAQLATLPATTSTPPARQAATNDREQRLLTAELSPREKAPANQAATPAPALSAPVNPQPAVAPAARGSADPYKDLPSLLELSLNGSIELQPLRLDIHVYSDLPAERFVFINMSKYREGDTLKEGPSIDAITDRGVVLVHQGRSFILARE